MYAYYYRDVYIYMYIIIEMMKLWKHIQAKEVLYIYYQHQLNSRIRKGIPEALRGYMWMYYLHYQDSVIKYGARPTMDVINSKLPAIVIEDIDKDVDRTFPTHELFIQGIIYIYMIIYVIWLYISIHIYRKRLWTK